MDEQLKKRLVGAAVLASLMVIFLPMLLEPESPLDRALPGQGVPESPLAKKVFDSKVQPLPSESPKPPPLPNPTPSAPSPIDQSFNAPIVKDLPAKPPTTVAVAKPATPAPPPAEKPPAKEPVGQEPVEEKPVAADPNGLSAWAIQVASFPEREKADQLIQELRAMKYAAFATEAMINGRPWYRVRIGPVADKVRAEDIQSQLRGTMAGKGLEPRVVKFP